MKDRLTMKIDINNALFNSRKIKRNTDYFPEYVNTYLKSYINFVENEEFSENIVYAIKAFSKYIYISLLEYYSGQHNSAKYFFDKAMDYIDFKEILTPLDEIGFYRARRPTEHRLSKNEMFHIPFEERYKVSTQRYSYPGLPCLYLGSSYEVCCDELGCNSTSMNIAYIEKNSQNKMLILNLHFFEKYDFENLSYDDVEKFIRLWPLVACCSFVYEDSNDMKFRPDYVIPQLLFEYIIDKNADVVINGHGEKIFGIKYYSVKKDFFNINDKTSSNAYNNFVFLAQSDQHSGYCNVLKEHFTVKWVRLLSEINES